MEIHYGQIVEMTVRKKAYSITELARMMRVERRTVYNWFNQKYLKKEIIHKIGCILKHDFSAEFPTLFCKEDFLEVSADKRIVRLTAPHQETEEGRLWKDRYISLLEQYNAMLLAHTHPGRTKVPEY